VVSICDHDRGPRTSFMHAVTSGSDGVTMSSTKKPDQFQEAPGGWS